MCSCVRIYVYMFYILLANIRNYKFVFHDRLYNTIVYSLDWNKDFKKGNKNVLLHAK